MTKDSAPAGANVDPQTTIGVVVAERMLPAACKAGSCCGT